MSGDLSKRMRWAEASISPTREVLEPAMRSLYDLPVEGSTEGVREVAQLTAWKAAQEFALEPVMAALNKLRDRDWDPEQPFLVTESVKSSWRDAPIRKYASFQDFYGRELEATWGKWTDLQETWRRVVRGELTEKQGEDVILGRHGVNQHTADGGVRNTKSSHSDTARYALARLDRAHERGRERPEFRELAARVRSGEMSANKAAIQAGFRKEVTALDYLRRGWKLASAKERQAFLWEIQPAKPANDPR